MRNNHTVLINHRKITGHADHGFLDKKLCEIIHSRSNDGRADDLIIAQNGHRNDKDGIPPQDAGIDLTDKIRLS